MGQHAQPDAQPSAASPAPSSRLESIDFLRGLAALSVVLLHAFNRSQWSLVSESLSARLFNIVEYGRLGVPLFFVLSGFCIHLRWVKMRVARPDETPRIDFFEFWKRRLFRLYPPYFVALCLSMVLLWLRWRTGSQIEYTDPARQFGIDFLLHATMLHGLHSFYDYQGGNEVFWTLAREEYFYLMYFALLSWRRAAGMRNTVLLVFGCGLLVPWITKMALLRLSGGASWWEVAWYPFNDGTSALALWIQWCLGMAAVEAYFGLITLPRWCRDARMAVFWALAVVVAQEVKLEPLRLLTPLLWGMTFFTLLNFCVTLEAQGRWPQTTLFKRLAGLGLFSYSLYLVHVPLLTVLQKAEIVARGKIGIPAALVASPIYQGAMWLLMVALACGAGKLFFLLVERWFLPSKSPKDLALAPTVAPATDKA